MPNLLISYLYRDEGNYKTFGTVIFSNNTNLAPEIVEKQLRVAMISTEFTLRHGTSLCWNLKNQPIGRK